MTRYRDDVIDTMSGRPQFRQLADLLRGQILDGTFGPGEGLPTQESLAAEYGLSVTTIRQAVDLLRREGLVESIRGRGVFVRTRPPVRTISAGRYAAQLAKLKAGESPGAPAFAVDHGVGLDEIEYECDFAEAVPPVGVADLLEVEHGTPVFARHMNMRLKDQRNAEQIRHSWHPLDLVAGTPMTDPSLQPREGGVIAELAALGVTVTSIDEDVAVRMPTPEESYVMRVQGGVPVIIVTRVSRAGTRVVEVAEMTMPGDRIELHYRTEL